MAFASWVETYAFAKISIIPSNIPPSIAPGIEPMPPKTAAVNAFMPGIALAAKKVQGWTGLVEDLENILD